MSITGGRRTPGGPSRATPAHGGAALAIGGDVRDGVGERAGSPHRHEQPVHPVVDDLAAAADVGGDDRQAHRGRLHRRAREALAVRRAARRGPSPRRASSTSSRMPRKRTPARSAAAMSAAVMASALSGSCGPTTTTRSCGTRVAQRSGRVEQLAVALLPDQPADEPARRRRRRPTPSSAADGARRSGRPRSGRSGPRSMPLPSRWSLRGGSPRRPQHRRRPRGSARARRREHVAATRSSAVDDGPLGQRVVGQRRRGRARCSRRPGTRGRAGRRGGRTRRASGCACARCRAQRAEQPRTARASAGRPPASAHRPGGVARADVADAQSASRPATYGPGADTPITS